MKLPLPVIAFAIFTFTFAAPAAPQEQPPGVPNVQNGTIPAPGANLPPETAGAEVLQNNNPDSGSTCQVSFGSCLLSAPAPLKSKCECNTLQFGEVAGWVVK
jgi:hypothetical protein